MKQKQTGIDASSGPITPPTAATRYHEFEHPVAAAMEGAITFQSTGKHFFQLRATQAYPQAPGIPDQPIKMIYQQRCPISINPDGFE